MTEESSTDLQTTDLDIEEKTGTLATALSALGEHAPKLVPSTVKKMDMALSTGIESIFYLCRGDSAQLWNLERRLAARNNVMKLVNEYEKMNEDDVTKAPMEVEVPLIEHLSKTQDEDISAVLVQLLVTASSKKHRYLVHPSFTNLVEDVSPDEVLLIRAYISLVEKDHGLPMIKVRSTDKRPEMHGTGIYIGEYFSRLYFVEGLAHPENVDFYIGNMMSLGLFQLTENSYIPAVGNFGKSAIHADHADHADYEFLTEKAPEVFPLYDPVNHKYEFLDCAFEPTRKGDMFLEIMSRIST